MKSIIPSIVVCSILLVLPPFAQGSKLSDWVSKHAIPREPARDAAKALTKVEANTGAAKTVVATQLTVADKTALEARIDSVAEEAKKAIEGRKSAEESVAIQKSMFLVALTGLVLTNTFTLGGFLSARRHKKLELKKLLLDIEEKELALRELKRTNAASDEG